jgi:hypothetical protein
MGASLLKASDRRIVYHEIIDYFGLTIAQKLLGLTVANLVKSWGQLIKLLSLSC